MLKETFIFASGVAVGALAMRYWFHTHYDEIEPEEETAEMTETTEEGPRKIDKDAYETLIKEHKYSRTAYEDTPYVISPKEFGELEDYHTITLTLYSDGVLTDENDSPIDPDEIGRENLESIGKYEDDAVHIRYDARKCDYEVLLDERAHEDILKTMPTQPVMDKTGDHLIVHEGDDDS